MIPMILRITFCQNRRLRSHSCPCRQQSNVGSCAKFGLTIKAGLERKRGYDFEDGKSSQLSPVHLGELAPQGSETKCLSISGGQYVAVEFLGNLVDV